MGFPVVKLICNSRGQTENQFVFEACYRKDGRTLRSHNSRIRTADACDRLVEHFRKEGKSDQANFYESAASDIRDTIEDPK